MNNFLINYNFKKYQLIENFEIKRNFYNNIINDNKINLSKGKIYLKNFPELRNGEPFFAHEPSVNLKLISKNDYLPFISIENDYSDKDVVIIFREVKNNILLYYIN
tara:strand:- start:302 stop:619 length:318 start_codon:yes stop_codon:yes gene_type:complete